MKRIAGMLIGALLVPVPAAQAEESIAGDLLALTVESCRGWEAAAAPASAGDGVEVSESQVMFRGRPIGSRFRLSPDATNLFELDVLDQTGRPTRFVGKLFNDFGDPLAFAVVDRACNPQVVRRIDYNIHGQALRIVTLDDDLQPRGEPEWLNPPLEFAVREAPAAGAAPLRVGLVDSGVNSLLPEINRRLARDAGGELVGYDFWDMDAQPFDAHPVDSGFFVQRHGTRTASLLLREAPGIELVPYRYPRPEMSRMRALVEHAAANGVGILGMPLGGNRAEEWDAFAESAREHPRMLFIVSAGNNGRDIDRQPVFPAALGLDNLLVVTSADGLLRPAPRTNWGRVAVDYLLPAERVEVTDFDGRRTLASGSSYAVARLAALAARLKSAQPGATAAQLKAALQQRFVIASDTALNWVAGGYIADPLAAEPPRRSLLARRPAAPADDRPRLPLEVLQLEPRWSRERIEAALETALAILGQCGIAAGEVAIHAVDAADYLRDLSVGGAYTLLGAEPGEHARVLFARDTRRQVQYTAEAFGLGNTPMRPWLANSVWLMLDVDDPGVALAHELYHVLANNGEHVTEPGNLMQGETRPDGTGLTTAQCRLALDHAIAQGLLRQ